MKKQDEGFTLIELLIVIVILGILAGVVVFAVSGITDQGQDSACAADEATLAVAVEAFYAKTNGYPLDQAALVAGGFLRAPSTLYTVSGNVITSAGVC